MVFFLLLFFLMCLPGEVSERSGKEQESEKF